MSRINKVKVDNVIYDIEDAEARDLINSLQTEFDDIKIPTKLSELENDAYYIKSTENAYFTNGVRMYNHNTQSDGRKVDLLIEHIQGVGYGGYEDDLHLNHRSSNDVRILEEGTGTLYYKGKEVADRNYVDEQISNIETSGGNTELPIASETTLGGIKVGANLTIDEDGTLNASASGGSGSSINIDALPIGSVILFDGDEIPEGYEEVKDYEPTYSLEEKRCGTWYNGKPIYRKVFKMLTPETKGSFVVIPHDITNIDEITNRIAFFRASNLYYYADFNEDSNHRFLCVPSTTDFSIFLGSALWSNANMTIILEYTKTTDEGVQ